MLRVIAMAALVVAALGSPQQAVASSQTDALRHGISWARARTWHWQDVAHVARSRPIKGAGGYHSPGYLRWVEKRWNRRRIAAYKYAHRPVYHAPTVVASPSGSVPQLICRVFGSVACAEAVHIAYRESHFETWAANGQYLGIFQMGSTERATYGLHDSHHHLLYSTAYEQIVAAHNYYLVAGWGPWAATA